MPRRNRNAARPPTARRRAAPAKPATTKPPTTDQLARSLVIRGLASQLVLRLDWRPTGNHQLYQTEGENNT